MLPEVYGQPSNVVFLGMRAAPELLCEAAKPLGDQAESLALELEAAFGQVITSPDACLIGAAMHTGPENRVLPLLADLVHADDFGLGIARELWPSVQELVRSGVKPDPQVLIGHRRQNGLSLRETAEKQVHTFAAQCFTDVPYAENLARYAIGVLDDAYTRAYGVLFKAGLEVHSAPGTTNEVRRRFVSDRLALLADIKKRLAEVEGLPTFTAARRSNPNGTDT